MTGAGSWFDGMSRAALGVQLVNLGVIDKGDDAARHF
jgi:hypothetical protein